MSGEWLEFVIPAKAGIHPAEYVLVSCRENRNTKRKRVPKKSKRSVNELPSGWIPAYAGMTKRGVNDYRNPNERLTTINIPQPHIIFL